MPRPSPTKLLWLRRPATAFQRCTYSPGPPDRLFSQHLRRQTNAPHIDVADLLSQPTWSVASLLPSAQQQQTSAPEITSQQLHHLLRLSALPAPQDTAEEERMLATLSAQLHFVRDVQGVDTTGVTPLRSLQDETAAGERAGELGLEALGEALSREAVRGKCHQRIRRRRFDGEGFGSSGGEKEKEEARQWDVLGQAGKRVGRFFVVEGGKEA